MTTPVVRIGAVTEPISRSGASALVVGRLGRERVFVASGPRPAVPMAT